MSSEEEGREQLPSALGLIQRAEEFAVNNPGSGSSQPNSASGTPPPSIAHSAATEWTDLPSFHSSTTTHAHHTPSSNNSSSNNSSSSTMQHRSSNSSGSESSGHDTRDALQAMFAAADMQQSHNDSNSNNTTMTNTNTDSQSRGSGSGSSTRAITSSTGSGGDNTSSNPPDSREGTDSNGHSDEAAATTTSTSSSTPDRKSSANKHSQHKAPDSKSMATAQAKSLAAATRSTSLLATAKLLASVDTRGMPEERKRALEQLREQLTTLEEAERMEARPKRHKAGRAKDPRDSRCAATHTTTHQPCRNAALLPLGKWGSEPKYCAEHIHLDANAVMTKCPGTSCIDARRPDSKIAPQKVCSDVVIRGIPACSKHISEFLQTHPTYRHSHETTEVSSALTATKDLSRVSHTILEKLRSEAKDARVTDPEVHQRLSKMVPKYQSIIRALSQHENAIMSRFAGAINHAKS